MLTLWRRVAQRSQKKHRTQSQKSSKSSVDQAAQSQGEINVEEEEPLPPSFKQTINEEQL